jgi:hypothetical protein
VAGWKRLVVVGAIEPGGAVERSAGILNELEVLVIADMLRSLEEQVLEEMCEAGAPSSLVLGADVVHEVDRDDRCGSILVKDDPQTIVEQAFLELEVDRARSWIGRRRQTQSGRAPFFRTAAAECMREAGRRPRTPTG